MKHRSASLRVLASTWLSLGWAGCTTTKVMEAPQPPAMPTIAPAPAAKPETAPLSAAERVVQAMQLARARDFGAAARLIGEETEPTSRTRLAQRITDMLGENEPVAAANFALVLPNGSGQPEALDGVARRLVERDAVGALAWAVNLPVTTARITARRAVAEQLVIAGGGQAIEGILRLPEGEGREEVLGFAAAAWARRDVDAALNWARALPEGDKRTRLIAAIGFEVAQTTPDRAMTVAALLPEGRNRWLLTSAAAQTWVVKDPKAAFAWANQLPAGAARDAAYAGFDSGLGTPSTRRIASAPGLRGSSRSRGGAPAATAWREGDTTGFELWLASQRTGMSREEALLEYVRQRGASEPGAIGQWLTTLPPGAARDRAMEAYLENVSIAAPRDAAEFVRSLPRSDQTPEMLERTARRLLRTDPGAAEALIRNSTLPEFRKEELLRDLPR